VTLGVREGERPPFAGLDPTTISFSFDQPMSEH
jgi:hypothetical protein